MNFGGKNKFKISYEIQLHILFSIYKTHKMCLLVKVFITKLYCKRSIVYVKSYEILVVFVSFILN